MMATGDEVGRPESLRIPPDYLRRHVIIEKGEAPPTANADGASPLPKNAGCQRRVVQVASEPIANYALLSDCRSAALVSISGSVDWLCFPRFDSPSAFAQLLGAEAGHWAVRP